MSAARAPANSPCLYSFVAASLQVLEVAQYAQRTISRTRRTPSNNAPRQRKACLKSAKMTAICHSRMPCASSRHLTELSPAACAIGAYPPRRLRPHPRRLPHHLPRHLRRSLARRLRRHRRRSVPSHPVPASNSAKLQTFAPIAQRARRRPRITPSNNATAAHT